MQHHVQMQWGLRIALRNAVHLSATLYLPANGASRWPAIFAMTPYISQSHHESGSYYAAHGYAFLAVDVRGRGNSEGEFHPLNEAQDGYDIAEWLADQPYCNGKVAMWGGSYLAHCQWAAAKERPPHLTTIVPVASPYYGVDFPMHGNIFLPYAMQWLTLVSGRTLQDKIAADRAFWRSKLRRWLELGDEFRHLDTFLGNPSPLFQEWISHPECDYYWDRYNPTLREYSQLSIPVLTITGAYDADQLGALEHYRLHTSSASPAGRARHYLIIGPWDHAGCAKPAVEFGGINVGPASLLDLRALHRDWYAWTMDDGAKPAFLKKNVAYYVIGADRWRYADTLAQATARTEPFYLHSQGNPTDVFSSGHLGRELPASNDADYYVYDPRDASLAELESTVEPQSLIDQRMLHAANGRHLIYHSAPFESDVEITGFFQLSLWLAIDRPDTDFRAAIYEVGIDGRAIRLTVDWMRARYREGSRTAKFIDTLMPLRYDFDRFMFVSRRMVKGSRLRLVIGPVDSIHLQRNRNSGRSVCSESMEDSCPVTVRLFHDESHPSALYVPFGRLELEDESK